MFRKILYNIKLKYKWGFERWKNFVETSKLEDEAENKQKKLSIFNLCKIFNQLVAKELKETFEILRENKRVLSLKKKFLLALFKTRQGRKYYAFEKWKSLPSKKELRRKDSTNRIFNLVQRLEEKVKKIGFDTLKEEWYQIREIKRRAIREIIYVTTSQKKRTFDTWRLNARNETHILKCKHTISVFETLTSVLKDNFAAVCYLDINAERQRAILR